MLKGKTALVTGGAKRIGAACVRALGQAGCNLLIHYRSSEKEAEELAREISALGVKVRTLQADLSREEEAAKLFDTAVELTGGVDLLINSASVFPRSSLEDLSWDALETNMRIHAWAPLILSRRFAAQPRFQREEDPIPGEKLGAIVNLLDTRIVDADPSHAAYHLSKRALFTLTRMMSLAFAPAVRVNAIAPGLILPPPGQSSEYLERYRKTNPLERIGSPEDISDALLYLATASFVTGQILYVDGGRRMRGSMYGS